MAIISRYEEEAEFPIPFGLPDELTLYINGTRYDEFNSIKAIKKLNQMSTLEVELEDVTSSDSNVAKGNTALIFTGNTFFQKYTITTVKNMSDGLTKIVGIGSGEETLVSKFVTRNVENESLFTASTSANVVTQTCSGVINVGTNTELGNITIRAEYDNKLKLLSEMSKKLDGDWWFDTTNTTDYSTDQFNVSSFRGSASSVYTLNISGNDQNMVESSREQDYENLWNSVRVLGFGDGINQLTSKYFHATDNRTTLSAAITSTATTINFTDGSQFVTGDIIWIGMEKVTLGTVTANQATGCTRGVTGNGALEAYAHNSGISCYLYTRSGTTYDEDSPEAGSSIDTNNLRQKTIHDKTIIDQNTLDLLSAKLLADHKDLVVRIKATVNDLYEFLDTTVEIGDTVTLNDSDAGLSSSEYRVVGYELVSEDSFEELYIEVSNGYTNLLQEVQGTQVDTDNLSRYMQGAPNIISVQSYENAQYSATPEDKALKMKFRIWDKTIAIQDARLDFKILPYRAYTGTTPSGGGTTTASGGSSTPTSSANSVISDFTGGSANVTGTSISTAGYTNIPSSTFAPSQNTIGVLVTFAFRETSSAGAGRMHFRVYDGSSYYPSAGSASYYNADGENSVTIFVPGNHNGNTLTPSGALGAGSGTPGTFDTNVVYVPFATHTHTVTIGTHTHTAPNHTHGMAYGISEDSDTPTVKVQIGDDDDWAATKAYINSGAAYSYGTNNNIDISSELKSLMGNMSSTKRIRIQFEPQGAGNTCRIEANADLFVHMSSD